MTKPVVTAVCFSPDVRFLATGSGDHTIRLWDAAMQHCIHTMRSDRPYERMDITGAKGLTPVQLSTLKLLGAMEKSHRT